MTNYYNDNEPFVAKWLAELVLEKLIPFGIIDGKDIRTIDTPLERFEQCHFFAGIGGWAEALRLARWPAGRRVWTGSCPCQPFSVSGTQRGFSDGRHLWPDWFKLIAKYLPSTIFGEQVASPLGREWLARVFTDLEKLGYSVAGADIPAASVGAPHIRQRLYWVADAGYGNGATRAARSVDESCTSISEGARSRSENDGMAKPSLARRETPSSGPEVEAGYESVERCGSMVRLDDSPESRCTRESKSGSIAPSWQQARLSELSGRSWLDSRPILCRDGNTRRIPIEPALFPLAHGVQSNRVGILRGAGNAIVPALAAQFIKAFLLAE